MTNTNTVHHLAPSQRKSLLPVQDYRDVWHGDNQDFRDSFRKLNDAHFAEVDRQETRGDETLGDRFE